MTSRHINPQCGSDKLTIPWATSFESDDWNNSLDLCRFLESGLRSYPRKLSSEEERGLLSLTAADNRASLNKGTRKLFSVIFSN